MNLSGRLDAPDRPGLITWSVNDVDARDALTEVTAGIPITVDDVGRICRVGTEAPYQYYELMSVDPLTWTAQNDLNKAAADNYYAAIGHRHDNATQDHDGFESAADKTKLDGIEEGATADQSPSDIKQAYESNQDTNALTDANLAKLQHIAVTNNVDLDNVVSTLNALSANAVTLAGTWDASAGTFPSGAHKGYTYIVSAQGTVGSVEFKANDRLLALVDSPATDTFAGNWFKLDYTDQVLSVAGRTGAIVLSLSDIEGAGTAAAADTADFATAAQGDKADSAVQDAPQDGTRYERINGGWTKAFFNSDGGDVRIRDTSKDLILHRYLRLLGGSEGGLVNGFGGITVFYFKGGSFDFRAGSGRFPSQSVLRLNQGGASQFLRFPFKATAYTVATLPSSPGEGAQAYATDGLKQSESTGNGTGVPVYYSNGGWLRTSDDTTVGA